jgi:hypothetical protein
MPYTDPLKGREYRRHYYAKRRAEDKTYARRSNEKWRETNPKAYMLSRAKSRAKAEGLPFDITTDDFEIPEFCPVFPDLRLEFSSGSSRPDNTPSLDKVIPERGYVRGNVRVVSMRANRLKSDATLEELKAILAYIENHIESESQRTQTA